MQLSSAQTPKTAHKQALMPIFRGFSADQAVQGVRKLKYTGFGVILYVLECALFSFGRPDAGLRQAHFPRPASLWLL
jgi:hypothetical protein